MSHRVEKRNGQGWRQAGHCLPTLEVNCSLKIKHPASHGRDREPLTWSEETARLRRRRRRREQGSWRKPEECIVFALPFLRHVMFSYFFPLPPSFPLAAPPQLLTPPHPTAGGHDSFPMWRFSIGQVSPVCVNTYRQNSHLNQPLTFSSIYLNINQENYTIIWQWRCLALFSFSPSEWPPSPPPPAASFSAGLKQKC